MLFRKSQSEEAKRWKEFYFSLHNLISSFSPSRNSIAIKFMWVSRELALATQPIPRVSSATFHPADLHWSRHPAASVTNRKNSFAPVVIAVSHLSNQRQPHSEAHTFDRPEGGAGGISSNNNGVLHTVQAVVVKLAGVLLFDTSISIIS